VEATTGRRDYELVRFIGRRLVQLVIVLLVVSFLTFLLIRLLPGDPVSTIIPFGQGPAFAHERGLLRADLGLNKGFFAQYWDYLKGLVQGQLGHQYSSGIPVSTLVKEALPVSLQLIIYSMILSLVIAVPLGVFGAYRAGTRMDGAINTTAFGLLALPNFVLALVLSFFVGAKLKWLPTGGYSPGWLDRAFVGDWGPLLTILGFIALGATVGAFIGKTRGLPGAGGVLGGVVGLIVFMVLGIVLFHGFYDLWPHMRTMLLPAITLAAGEIAVFQRLLRSDMIQTLQENFITLAKAKGISNTRILWRHALRPSSFTLLTVAGLTAGTLIGGAVVIEVIFSVPGMGQQIFEAINAREYVALQSYIVIIAVGFVLLNFFVDFLYAVLDPRIRRARAA
jgi:peptide/nickel transport system permease protein